MGELDVSGLLSVAQAIDVIDRARIVPRVLEIASEEAAGMRLAEDRVSDRDYPPFDKSLMDGFAVRLADLEGGGERELKVVGEVAAGQWPARGIEAGEAMAIMTGAPIPTGADGVVPVEQTQRSGDGAGVRVLNAPSPGRYIAARGSDCPAGRVVLKQGQTLTPARLAVAASIGAARVRVFARPRISVLATGDELVPVELEPGPAQIRNSNNPMLVALLRRADCEVVGVGSAPDQPDLLREQLREGLMADVLFVTGGMSMGEHDYVPRLLQELGVRLHITKLRIKPGKPFVFGSTDAGKYVFGLPGNPVSAFVCTVRLAARLLRRMAGGEASDGLGEAVLESSVGANGPREFYQPGVRRGNAVRPLVWKGSADLFTLAEADALIVRPENDPARPAGSSVAILEL